MSVKIGRNDPCWCGSGRKYKTCHQSFDEKIEKYREAGCIVPTHDLIKTPKDIEGIRESAKINVAVLDYVAEHIKAGMSTEEIDRMVYEKTTAMGGIPAPLNYQGFPKSVCTSINEEVCHGIPSEDIILKDGDIINVDVSTILDGYFSDSSRMFLIGDVSEEKKRLGTFFSAVGKAEKRDSIKAKVFGGGGEGPFFRKALPLHKISFTSPKRRQTP